MQFFSDNRAVSSLFRVFGGAGEPLTGEAVRRAEAGSLHRAEWFFLSIMVPWVIAVALGEGLISLIGPLWGTLALIPSVFIGWTILPFLVGGSSAICQWRRWLLVLTAWAIWRRDAGGIVSLTAWIWIGVFVLNAFALGFRIWQRSMLWKGRLGLTWRIWIALVVHLFILYFGMAHGIAWALLAGAAFSSFWCWAVLKPSSQWLGPILCNTADNQILITIDDGPDPDDTPALLDLLDAYQTKAIFFVIGEKVRQYPELAREILRRGHQIGNHTLTHPQASFWCAGPLRTHREIVGCQTIIEEVTGVRPRWFRAPVGHRNFFTHPICGALNLSIMAWSRRGYDAISTDTPKILRQLLHGCQPGDIFLIHESTTVAAEVLQGLLDGLKDRGLLTAPQVSGVQSAEPTAKAS